MNVAVVSITPL